MKVALPIDRLIEDAFRTGIPKETYEALTSSIGHSALELGTRVSGGMWYEPRSFDDLSGDFKIIQNAVLALRTTHAQLNWGEEGQFLLGSLVSRLSDREILNQGGRLLDSGAMVDIHQINVGMLVLTHAMHRNFPRWNFGEQLIPLQARKGTPPRFRLVCPNAFGKLEEISPLEIARARHEYQVWFEAIRDLSKSLSGLEGYSPMPPNAAFAPWLIKNPALSHYNSLILENFSTSQKTSLQAEGT